MVDRRLILALPVAALAAGAGLTTVTGAPWWCDALVVTVATTAALVQQERARATHHVRPAPRPAHAPPPAPRARLIVPSDDDERRPVDVELSTALLRSTRDGDRELQLQPDERPGTVDPPWTPAELGAARIHMLHVVVPQVPLVPGAKVWEDAERVCRHLTDLYPALAADALEAYRWQYCHENR